MAEKGMLLRTKELCFEMRKEDVFEIMRGNNYVDGMPLVRWIFWKRLEIILDIIRNIKENGSVLDFGCGMGTLLPALSLKFKNVFGVDINEPKLEVARQLCSRLSLKNVKVFKVDPVNGLRIFKDQKMNCITACDVLEHVQTIQSLLSDFAKLLTEDGQLFVSLPKENFAYRLAQRILTKHLPSQSKHVWTYGPLKFFLLKKFSIKKEKNLLNLFKFFQLTKLKRQTKRKRFSFNSIYHSNLTQALH